MTIGMDAEAQKRLAAEHAVTLVEDGMTVGLGTGSTAKFAISALGERVAAGLRVVGVPTSDTSAELARSLGILLATLEERPHLDLAIDGADEVNSELDCIKGRGGALLREKIVASAAARFVVIVDESKRVTRLGERAPLPVEVVPFGWTTTKARLESLGLTCELRTNGLPYRTANGNYILDCRRDDGESGAHLDLTDPSVAETIKTQTGVVEHGLFLGLASTVVVGTSRGAVETFSRRPD